MGSMELNSNLVPWFQPRPTIKNEEANTRPVGVHSPAARFLARHKCPEMSGGWAAWSGANPEAFQSQEGIMACNEALSRYLLPTGAGVVTH